MSGASLSSVCLSQDNVLIRSFIDFGSSRRMGGGCMVG